VPADSLSWSSSLSFDGTRGRERNGSRYLYLPVKNTIIEFCYHDKVQMLKKVQAFRSVLFRPSSAFNPYSCWLSSALPTAQFTR
jgi:hypothetical protein